MRRCQPMLSNAWAIVWGLLGVLRGSWQDILSAALAMTILPVVWILAAIL